MRCFATIIIITYFIKIQALDSYGDRKKRTLIYPDEGSHIQVNMIMGVGLPLVLHDEAIIVGMVIKASYKLPFNGTIFTKPRVEYIKKKRAATRWDLYKTMEQAAKLQGFGEKGCILRTICEIADTPFEQNRSVLEELLHAVFTPSSTNEFIEHQNGAYHAAEKLGKNAKGRCRNIFPDCHVNFSDIFTRIYSL